MIDLKIGDYVSFNYDEPQLLYRVLDIKIYEDGKGYFLYYNEEYQDTGWERFEYIARVFEVKEKGQE